MKKKKEKKTSEPTIKFHTKERGEMTIVDCISCGLPFAIPDSFLETAVREFGETFYCPRGHNMFNVRGRGKRNERKQRDEQNKQAEEKKKQEQALLEKEESRGLLGRILFCKLW